MKFTNSPYETMIHQVSRYERPEPVKASPTKQEKELDKVKESPYKHRSREREEW